MLLTAQRARKVAKMQRADLKTHLVIPSHETGDGVVIPERRMTNIWNPSRDDDPANKQVSVVPLSDMTRKIIAKVPIIDNAKPGDFVFSVDGHKSIGGWSLRKAKLDRMMLEELQRQARQQGEDPPVSLPPWQFRDLRRTARTLMSRAGIQTEIAELCLGHARDPMVQTYDRFDYVPQQREAFAKLATWVERIVAAGSARRSSTRQARRSPGPPVLSPGNHNLHAPRLG